jgi:hypothetical protein
MLEMIKIETTKVRTLRAVARYKMINSSKDMSRIFSFDPETKG